MENGVWYILAALIMGWTGFCIYKWIKNRKRNAFRDPHPFVRMRVRLHGLPPQREM